MTGSKAALLGAGVLTLSAACSQPNSDRENGRPGEDVASQPGVSCLSQDNTSKDSLVFSYLSTFEETGDVSGYRITLVHQAGSWHGFYQKAIGELDRNLHALSYVNIDPGNERIEFSMVDVDPNDATAYADTSRFQGLFGCDSISGGMTNYPSSPPVPMSLRREMPAARP